jgi:hypothetical protein
LWKWIQLTFKPNIFFGKIACIFFKIVSKHNHNKTFKTWVKYFPPFFQLYAWKCVVLLPSPNIIRYNGNYHFLIVKFSQAHNHTQK